MIRWARRASGRRHELQLPLPVQADPDATMEALIRANADYPLHGELAVHLWRTYAEVSTLRQALAAADAVENALDRVDAVTAYRGDLARNQGEGTRGGAR